MPFIDKEDQLVCSLSVLFLNNWVNDLLKFRL